MTDSHDGLLAAVSQGFSTTPRQCTDQINVFTTEMSCLTIEGINCEKSRCEPAGTNGKSQTQQSLSHEPALKAGLRGGRFLRFSTRPQHPRADIPLSYQRSFPTD